MHTRVQYVHVINILLSLIFKPRESVCQTGREAASRMEGSDAFNAMLRSPPTTPGTEPTTATGAGIGVGCKFSVAVKCAAAQSVPAVVLTTTVWRPAVVGAEIFCHVAASKPSMAESKIRPDASDIVTVPLAQYFVTGSESSDER